MRWDMIIAIIFPLQVFAQEPVSTPMEEQLENIAENYEDAEITDDSWMQQMAYFKKHQLDLNKVTETELTELQLLTPLQISQLLQYRKLAGNLISIYELQAVPGWDIPLIQKILPYITINNDEPLYKTLVNRFGKGNQTFQLRYSTLLQKSKGYTERERSNNHYTGSQGRVLIRYKYQYKNLLQYGLTASKDAGEGFLGKHQKAGFDFYSIHFFARNIGIVQSVALGDYTINLGQGLICWQGLTFGTGADAANIKKQSPVLRPYNSSGVYFFNRGAAITVGDKRWQATGFFSSRKLDANTKYNDEWQSEVATSIHVSGYHRTASEIEDRKTFPILMYGGNISYKTTTHRIGLNAIGYSFGKPLVKESVPYNLYSLSGKRWSNYSIDYSFTLKNIHFFGETSVDANHNFATINGLIVSVDSKADVTLLQRSISSKYQSFYGSAYTVNSMPTNEQGWYIGAVLKLFPTLRFDLSADIFHFPWLKYRVDAPSDGSSYLIQCLYKPSKYTEIYTRFRSQQKPVNRQQNGNPLNVVAPFSNQSWRTQINHLLSKQFSIRQRFEMVWYNTENKSTEKGFLTSFDLFYKSLPGRLNANFRIQYFASDSYNSRIYAHENDVLYYYAIPAYYDKGIRYYVNLKYSMSKSVGIWLKWGETIYKDKNKIGSGLDEIDGRKKSEIRLLVTLDL